MTQPVGTLWTRVSTRYLPFADATSADLPLSRLMRLALFQVSVGMALVLLNGTLNRVMIVEMGMPTWLVALMVALPVLIAPFRALLGFRSDTHRSVLGWRRTPFLWFGTLLQFGGLAIMPFALIVLSGDSIAPPWVGHAGAGMAFLLVGAGLHTTQTAGLALATDLATEETRPQVVALLYVMLLVGMGISAFVFGALLADFSQVRLIKVIQGAAAVTFVLNMVALWKQESLRQLTQDEREAPKPKFRDAWADFIAGGRAGRLLLATALGTLAFSMQDILLEPYGGQVLHLAVGQTTALTGLWAVGSLTGFAVAGWLLAQGRHPCALAAWGCVVGLGAFAAVIFAAPLDSAMLFRAGAGLIGFGAGLFAIGTLTAAMGLGKSSGSGLALGAWGAAQATAGGIGVGLGGGMRDIFAHLAQSGALGPALTDPNIGYSVVYHSELVLLLAAIVVIGPLVQRSRVVTAPASFGLAEFPT